MMYKVFKDQITVFSMNVPFFTHYENDTFQHSEANNITVTHKHQKHTPDLQNHTHSQPSTQFSIS